MSDSNPYLKVIVTILFLVFVVFFFFPENSNAQNKEVVAQKGDGIYRLLTRHGLSVSENTTSFIELNKSKLGKDNSLFAGSKYILPSAINSKSTPNEKPRANGKVVKYKIFGKDYEDVEIESSELSGATYYLVGGHGGPDPGAVGKYNGKMVCEDEYAYDVTIRLARNLIQEGASVYLITRDQNDGIRDESLLKPDKDEVCYPSLAIPLNVSKRLRQRTDAVNKLYSQNKNGYHRMIAVHVDSRSKGENIDVFFYHDKRSKTGEKAARILHKTFQDKYNEHQPGRGYKGTVSHRSLYVVRNTYPVAVFIELGNINHQRDIQRFIIADNRQALANWLTLGLITDFKTNK